MPAADDDQLAVAGAHARAHADNIYEAARDQDRVGAVLEIAHGLVDAYLAGLDAAVTTTTKTEEEKDNG